MKGGMQKTIYRYSRRAFFFFVLSVKLGSSCCGLDAPSFPRLKMQLVLIPPSYLITYSFVQTGLFFWGVPLPLSFILYPHPFKNAISATRPTKIVCVLIG